MAIYTAIVIETVAQHVRYEIEAESEQEAQEKAYIGDTISETNLRTDGVINREVNSISIQS